MEMQDGTISRWLKQAGDQVAEGEVLAEVETDKVTAELKAPASGSLEEVCAAQGETVDVGGTVAIIHTDGPA
jgi:pyruvate/2-oxoglutarate dehydrogenase complex dihydrolipoamide acyltransferase (E2) component